MVNTKDFAFKVNKQTPANEPQPQAYGTVIDCRPGVKKRSVRGDKEVTSRRIRLTRISYPDGLNKKRKWDPKDLKDGENGDSEVEKEMRVPPTGTASQDSTGRPVLLRKPQLAMPTKFRRGTVLKKNVDLDSWFTILRFSDPAQLLEMRAKIALCYRFLRDNPMLWKHSRNFFYDDTLPDPPSELTEFQYAHLRHGHGCMSCHTKSTRKTYWAFLRRWCKTCLHAKTIKEQDVVVHFQGVNEEHYLDLLKCLPVGVFDSWENFVGAGPGQTHSLKNVYLLRDVEQLVADYKRERAENPATWHAESRVWMSQKEMVQQERYNFARKMELWEEQARQSRSSDFNEKKAARKKYFKEKAAELIPPITGKALDSCPSSSRN
ncbi:hypothetical protein N0V90_008172 [Kalmusia sp. IMI 367209]|nr:hypothetical protein N0V90_008172 [Kalmusia sp. IMI 367209]